MPDVVPVKKEKPITAVELAQALRLRYPLEKGWLVMTEATPPVQRGKTARRFDVVVISLWKSMGLHVHGYEIKVSRSDWLRELENPEKANMLRQYCTAFWAVAPRGLIAQTEMPVGWGLLEGTRNAKGVQLRKAIQAQQTIAEGWDDQFWQCMLLRAVHRDEQEITQRVNDVIKARGLVIPAPAPRPSYTDVKYNELLGRVKDYEKASGISIYGAVTTPTHIGKLVRLLSESETAWTIRSVENLKTRLQEQMKNLDTLGKELGKLYQP